jgi:hypothetical protein
MSRANEIRELFARWRESGQSLMTFGKREGVSYTNVLYCRRKFDEEGQESPASAEKPLELVPVKVTDTNSDSVPAAKFEVWFPNGVWLDIALGFDEEELRRFVGVSQSCQASRRRTGWSLRGGRRTCAIMRCVRLCGACPLPNAVSGRSDRGLGVRGRVPPGSDSA